MAKSKKPDTPLNRIIKESGGRRIKGAKKANRKKEKDVHGKDRYGDSYKNKKTKYLKETRGKDGQLIVPSTVVDKVAYAQYIKLFDKLIADPDQNYQTSDPELIINPMWNMRVLTRRCSHLPEEEFKKICDMSSRIRSLSSMVCIQKRKAFGTDVFSKDDKVIEHRRNIKHGDFFRERGAEILEYFGRLFTAIEIHKIIVVDWNHPIDIGTLNTFRFDNAAIIQIKQEEYKRSYSDVRLGVKRSRLDELNYLFITRKDIYGRRQTVEDSKELRAIIEQVRKEVEGDTLNINADINANINLTLNGVVNDQLMKGINIKALIVSRVAAKLNVNPVILEYQLLNSYYAKFTGNAPADGNILTDEIVYPSAYIYDFDAIKHKNIEIIADEATIIEEYSRPMEPDEKSSVDDIRTQVMRKLIENRAAIKSKKDNINGK